MRSVGIVLGAVYFLACSSSSTSKVVRDGPDGSDGGASDGGNPADTGNPSDRGNLGDRVENDVGAPGDAGDEGDSSVAMGPVVFDPATVELRANASAPVRVRLGPGAAPGTTLEVTLTLESTPAGDAGSGAPLSLSKSTFLLSSPTAALGRMETADWWSTETSGEQTRSCSPTEKCWSRTTRTTRSI